MKIQENVTAYLLISLILLINFFILGRYGTLYGLGVFLLVPVFIISGIIGTIAFFVHSKSLQKAANACLVSLMVLLVTGALLIKFENYASPRFLLIPADYSGTVYLFHTKKASTQHIQVDENGIAYVNLKKGYDFRVKQGWRDISLAYNKALNYEVLVDSTDFTKRLVDVICFDVEPGKSYPKTYGPFYYNPCLDGDMFWQWVKKEQIDTAKVLFTIKPLASP